MRTSTTTTTGLILTAMLLCCSHAYLTGERCRDMDGRFSLRWSQCHLCSVQNCRCVYSYIYSRYMADCDRVAAASIRPPYGCSIGSPTYDGSNLNCCPFVCEEDPLGPPETCTSSFGVSFSEGDTWTECLVNQSCCFDVCACTRTDGQLAKECHRACHGVQFPYPGCSIGTPFQNSTFHECCPIECPPAQCTSSFGQTFNIGETWDECSPGRSCCSKSCECAVTENGVEPRCFEACPGIRLEEGCRIIKPFQNATHKDCCRTECQGGVDQIPIH